MAEYTKSQGSIYPGRVTFFVFEVYQNKNKNKNCYFKKKATDVSFPIYKIKSNLDSII